MEEDDVYLEKRWWKPVIPEPPQLDEDEECQSWEEIEMLGLNDQLLEEEEEEEEEDGRKEEKKNNNNNNNNNGMNQMNNNKSLLTSQDYGIFKSISSKNKSNSSAATTSSNQQKEEREMFRDPIIGKSFTPSDLESIIRSTGSKNANKITFAQEEFDSLLYLSCVDNVLQSTWS
eukprot:TRINITY_DN3790_c2_g2_i3.p1 TRINITY_DN3790_c2_g2~~TRINITY_DN3790_c2_g2_i3.p1  ORF type:complete len:174 (+),score=84.05 TRINITY_DN3790_c2_g2_i3:190-711(+)